MKKHTQLALIGTIVMAISQLFNLVILLDFLIVDVGLIHFLFPIINLLGMLSLVNFFYQLYQKQNQKINATFQKSENPFENQES